MIQLNYSDYTFYYKLMGSNGSKGSFSNMSGVNNTVNFVKSSGQPTSNVAKLIAVAKSPKNNK